MTVTLYQGDCLEVMATLPADSVDSIVTDPPYGISFMGKDWDHGIPGAAFWREALRVAKPGALLLAFGGTRTFHRLAVAIEDAGWEIRDTMSWLYGQGFPKSHDISKAIDRAAGEEREIVGERIKLGDKRAYPQNPRKGDEIFVTQQYQSPITAPATSDAQQWSGWGTALKPAWEPIIVAMKPLAGTFAANALAWGVAGLWIDGSRITVENGDQKGEGGRINGTSPKNGKIPYDGGLRLTTGHDGKGRWPANVLLDEDAAAALDAQSGISASRFFYVSKASRRERNMGLEGMPEQPAHPSGNQWATTSMWNGENGDEAWRKKNPNKPQANHHPTVKPLALMRYLCRLTATPTGGVVLDPFMGSGTTGMAAVMEGRDFIGIELDGDYLEIARRRITAAAEQARQLALTLE